MEEMIVKNSIAINAGAAEVWDVLTHPAQTKKYMFGCEAVSSWKQGSPLLWQGEYEGKTTVFVKGYILEIIPNRLLKYSVIDPNAAYPDLPENYLSVAYKLENKDGCTWLTVIQDGFEDAAEGEKRFREVYNNGEGWNPILVQIKKIAEEN
ncbi:SRPBCC domain-containing protein [Parafilimonas sp.]|uniref:SRPBCC domain-containing protein n=1 Tax=Parafilimonas sp. TaxID=1969739 RepID=UPI0039E427F5